MRFTLVALLAALTAAGPAWPQAAPAKRPPKQAGKSPSAPGDPAQWPIREIRVTGAKRYTAKQIVAASGLKGDSVVSKETLEQARDRLLATGFIEGVGWKYEPLESGGAFRVTLEINEPDQFLPWILDRVPVEKDAFTARVQAEIPMFGEMIPPTDALLQRISRVLEKIAAEKGVNEPMAGKVTLIQKDTIAVVFGPQAPPPNVAEVRFAGARVIDPRYLVKSLAQVAIGLPYIESNFRMVLENQIRPMYDSVRRLRASFAKLTVEPAVSVKGVVVTVHVDEGAGFTLEDIDVRGSGLSDQDLKDAGQFKTGETVNYSEIGKGLNRILDALKGGGYMKAAYKAQRRINDEKKSVSMVVDVDPGPQYRFGKLEIKGLDLHSEPVIRKLWAMKPGDPYRGGYPDMFLNQVRDRGIFDDLGETTAGIKTDDRNLLVDVLLTFKGAPPKPEPKRPDW